ncbi:MAG: glycine oxidase ThiO [Rhizomicrobium sp.]|jgi:glycine oxidase
MKVVIIGAGAAGLSIGWRLRQAGAVVTILDRGEPGRGATWAAAGMLSIVGQDEHSTRAETAFALWSHRLWPGFAAQIEQQTGQSLGYRRDGKLVVARTEQEFAALSRRCALKRDMSPRSAAEACALEPMLRDDVAGAFWDDTEAQVDNRALGPALLQAFLRIGGRMCDNEMVVGIESDKSHVTGVRTHSTVHRGDVCVLAAGAWSSRIEGLPPSLDGVVIPIKGEMIAFSGGEVPKRIVWGNGVYLVPRRNRLLVGATSSDDGFDTEPTESARDWLASSARDLMPDLCNWELVEHWAGLRPGSQDGLPVLGRTELDGLIVASGQYRNGILFAPAIAEAVRTLVCNQPSPVDISSFNPARFPKVTLADTDTVG